MRLNTRFGRWSALLIVLLAVLLGSFSLFAPSPSVSAQGTSTPSSTPTNTPITPSETPSSTPTNTPITPSETPSSTPTNTPITPSETPSSTPTGTPTGTASSTPTNTPTGTPTSTPTSTPVPFCPTGSGDFRYTTILGQGMGSTNSALSVVRVDVPTSGSVLALYGQLAGKQQGDYRYARFLRPNGTFINDKTKESPAYRRGAIFWYGTNLTPATAAYWRARLIDASTKSPFPQRAFILYPTYASNARWANAFATFADSSQNHVYWDTADGWTPAQQLTLPLAPPVRPVDVIVMAAVVDNDRDNKAFQLTISAGTASQTVTLNNPTNGDLLNIVSVTLSNVPAGTNQVVFDLVSPVNGDSVALVGATARYACDVP